MTQEEDKIFTFWEVIATDNSDDDAEVNTKKDEALSLWDFLSIEKSPDDQMEIIVIKHDTIGEHLRDLMRISESVTKEEQDSVREIIDLVSDGMGEAKDLLIESCRSVLTPLQLSVLSDRDDMGCDNIDPSILFLGLDWAALFLRWKTCREKMQMVRIALRENRVDLAVLTAVLEIIEITRHSLEMSKRMKFVNFCMKTH